jgi:putative ABC transport system ATP-binding protein
MPIEINNLRKTFTTGVVATTALDAVSLTIEPGQFVTITGPSGSGKSTLLYLIGGIDRPDSGTLQVNQTNVNGCTERELAHYRLTEVGFIFQAFHLLPNLTVYNNVVLPAMLAKMPIKRFEERATTLLERLGMAAQRNKLPHQLSGGQQQRVAIARALINDPWLLLADEPTGNLDSEAGAWVLNLLIEEHQQGKTLLMVTHDSAIASRGERCLQLRDGRIVGDTERGSAAVALDSFAGVA